MKRIHYNFVGPVLHRHGHELRRIQATMNLPALHVRRGDVGGWVEGFKNLTDRAWVADDAEVYGGARVSGTAYVCGDAMVFGDAEVSETAQVGDKAIVYAKAKIYGNARVVGRAEVSGSAKLFGNAMVSGLGRVSGNAQLSGTAVIRGDLWICGNARISSARDLLWMSAISPGKHDILLYRSSTKRGYHLEIGPWSGSVENIAVHVARERKKFWQHCSERDIADFEAEYQRLQELLAARIATWRGKPVLTFEELKKLAQQADKEEKLPVAPQK